ncbi:C2 domain protein [Gregarina niphandrodes]|uniref:C2 domain protein n=2 Tax=Gregarina niphandrodes TaxID=110365 RepID=A0A023AXF2_GRENI|nr:C2 domain protein [Gregarina niphandrodes]XP_011131840.1 C2 domain protein [Gregarina niphandrodes]XP_011133129.1 C2 domain protein [Gregarina niphandrodes]XP_011133607.1 C2 domain protein [Gregarina niphandrodes]XP_011133614.1 C2 domain protein [Gregarina niphandrodes]EZG43128.1 C2 domain protein [Gregarina niphandrodes]EZG43136.1 C2 domain protein [Gregarina niphandrodes]EZG43641.1 C2 domain protein [Gregarina niphandrodes]EZG54503.1 C2 domain protein [Gregarina niphandrodes]EZG57125.|eukprot:XP_011131108.1 C2 domain protein [Gregarina niphandrodes]
MKVSVTVHSAAGFQGHTGLFNKSDLYVECHYGTFHSWHTKTAKDAGSSADFEETWTFDSNDSHSEITIKVRDARHLKLDETLAEGAFKFEQRPGYFYTGEVGLVDEKHGDEPSVRLTVKCE